MTECSLLEENGRAHFLTKRFDREDGRKLHMQTLQMFRRVVFNVVMRNQDDHTKNISFLMDENGKWTLAPAYDVCYAYNPSGIWTAVHQMSVNGRFDGISRNDLLELASVNNVRDAAEIIDCVCENAAKWPGMALNCGVPEEIVRTISKNSGVCTPLR